MIRSLTHLRRDILRQILIVVALGAFAASGAALVVLNTNRAVILRRLDALATEKASRVSERMRTYEYGLRGVRGAIIGSSVEGMDRALFRSYAESRDLEREFAGSRGMGYIIRVPKEGEEAFLERMRRDSRPAFSIQVLEPHGGERFVISYLEPESLNARAVGLDIASDKSRAAAARAAMETGRATLTGPITLVQAAESPERSFLFLLPVYRARVAPREASPADVVGWAYMPLVTDEIMDSLIERSAGYDLTLYDVTDPASPLRFFSSRPDAETDGRGFRMLALRHAVRIELYGRVWDVEVSATPVFIASLNLGSPWGVAFVAGLIAVLGYTSLSVFLLNRTRKRIYSIERDKFAALVDSSSDAIIGHTRRGIITAWNRSAAALFGIGADDALGKSFLDLAILEENRGEEEERLRGVLSGTSIASYPTVCATAAGGRVDVSMSMSPIRGPNGVILGVTRTIRDIGEAKSFEAKLIALNNSLERLVAERTADLDERNKQLEATSNGFLQIIESAPYALIMVDREGRIAVFNSMAERIFGYPRDELIGLPIETLIPDRFIAGHAISRMKYTEHPQSRPMGMGRDLTAKRRNGSEFPVEIGLSPVETPSGMQVLAAVIDISARREHERLLEQYGAFQEAILSNAGFAIIATDPEGVITLFNPAAERMLGYSAEELVVKATPELIHVRGELEARARSLSIELGRTIEPGFECFVARARSGRPDEYEWSYVRKDGSRIPVLLNVSALFDGQGAVLGFLGIAVDLTERNENARKLRAYSEGLSEMVAAKSLELRKAQERLLNQERLQRDLELAAAVQESLLPKSPPQTDRYDIAMYAKPARFVSGDVYDMVAGQGDQLFLFLADVSGKGIPAAIMASSARILFKQGVPRNPRPEAILAEIDENLSDDLARTEMFMTCQICRIDHRTGLVHYANAGHTESFAYRPGTGETQGFSPTNLPVGLRLDVLEILPGELTLPVIPGDFLIFYSDGLTECEGKAGEYFGSERLKDALKKYGGKDASLLMEGILAELREFAGDREAEDDITVVVVRVLPLTISTDWHLAPAEYDRIVASLVEVCGRYGSHFAYEVDLLVSELLSNIVRHAYGYDLSSPESKAAGTKISIRTEISLAESGLVLDLFDDGAAFKGSVGIAHLPIEPREGGYGLGILSVLSDEVSYERSADGLNHWRIAKSIKEGKI